ncbi:hypothetical protein B0T17DRAFT_309535 [Bombardia bombarda]|uniref:Azaphilone pigments biosynthesis cluster protein L N-terminal domain-containing protein n=1 Tax=Bombardia bombarda TaxID=252184 RepID=A0AA39WUY4_9PEZI|nr:hypothetical protein B0T17DRAFT_309535 [Bombardia bombarda]
MDPLSIAAGSLAVITTLAKTSCLIKEFVRTYRAARSDLSNLNQEINDLEIILHAIHDAASDETFAKAAVPMGLQDQLTTVIASCNGLVGEIFTMLDEYRSVDRFAHWASIGKKRVKEQVALLEGYRKILDMSLTAIDL